jgi:hypothetical protein
LGAAALNMPRRKDKKKKKKTGRNAKKKVHIFMVESKLVFLGWKWVPEPWNIGWCHISRSFPHSCYRLHCIMDKANLHHCKWPIFKERYIEMCQHIYNTLLLSAINAPSPLLEWYAKVVFGRRVDWTTINIQS